MENNYSDYPTEVRNELVVGDLLEEFIKNNLPVTLKNLGENVARLADNFENNIDFVCIRQKISEIEQNTASIAAGIDNSNILKAMELSRDFAGQPIFSPEEEKAVIQDIKDDYMKKKRK